MNISDLVDIWGRPKRVQRSLIFSQSMKYAKMGWRKNCIKAIWSWL